METKNSMSSEEGLLIIKRMITTAKEELEDNSFYFLIWGWLVFVSCVIHFIQIKMNSDMQGIGWLILMPLGGIITMIYSYRQDKKQRVRSYVSDLMGFVMIAFFVSLMVVLIYQGMIGLATYPLVMLIYGTWLFINGGALKFRPLLIGGIINWSLAVASFYLPFEKQLITLAAAVLFGYIIPGYLLKRRYQIKTAN
jgi:hypothetical protein